MKKKIVFRGTATAMITPFCNDAIDTHALRTLAEEQIGAGIDALVIGGTTGEAATLSDGERYALYRTCAEMDRGHAKLILGTGTNDTKAAIRHTKRAAAIGADAVLVVTPYYNKGTSEGIVEHYRRIADASSVPVLLYNVPTRTGVNLTLEQLDRLADEENIVGIKEASDSVDRLIDLSAFGDRLWLYSGNDSQIHTTLSLGGLGVISVASNLIPQRIAAIADLFFEGRHYESRQCQLQLLPLIRALFVETNPAPIKYAMSLYGKCREEVRLPLSPPVGAQRALLRREAERILGHG